VQVAARSAGHGRRTLRPRTPCRPSICGVVVVVDQVQNLLVAAGTHDCVDHRIGAGHASAIERANGSENPLPVDVGVVRPEAQERSLIFEAPYRRGGRGWGIGVDDDLAAGVPDVAGQSIYFPSLISLASGISRAVWRASRS
jgi:hypothetical protein